jgi:hypothetical protein
MSKAKKEGKPKGNRANIVKNLKNIARNEEVLKKLKN